MRPQSRWLKRICIMLGLLLSLWAGAGFCVSEAASGAEFFINQRLSAGAGEMCLSFLPDLTGDYVLASFSEGTVEAEVRQGEATVASGALPLTVRLNAEVETEVLLKATDAFTFEIMRASLGRSAFNPLAISAERTNRSLTRARDVHWFQFTAESAGTYLFKTVRGVNGGVNARLNVFDENGALLAETVRAEDSEGAFVTLSKGDTCLLRVAADGESTGKYSLLAHLVSEDAPAALSPAQTSYALQTGQWQRLTPQADADPELFLWASSDETVATVSGEGMAAAMGEGACKITCLASNGASVTFSITVSRAFVRGVAFDSDTLAIACGDSTYLSWSVLPSYAANQGVQLESSDESVAAVQPNGYLQAISEGEATITITTDEGGFQARLLVTVHKPDPVYRALLVGIANYVEDGRSRQGAVNTTQGVSDALTQTRYSATRYLTDMRLDLTAAELLTAIDEVLGAASEADISLLYINCHGGVTAGIPWIEMQDGVRIPARQLEGALRRVPGRVVLILDCCNSGAFIGKADTPDSFVRGVVNTFSSGGRLNAFASSKYKVLVSSSYDQKSYRIASGTSATESTVSTVFARAFTEALGWDLMKDKTISIRGDLDNNRQITLNEAFLYARKRCMYYLTNAAGMRGRQAVQVWPEGDTFLLAG